MSYLVSYGKDRSGMMTDAASSALIDEGSMEVFAGEMG